MVLSDVDTWKCTGLSGFLLSDNSSSSASPSFTVLLPTPSLTETTAKSLSRITISTQALEGYQEIFKLPDGWKQKFRFSVPSMSESSVSWTAKVAARLLMGIQILSGTE